MLPLLVRIPTLILVSHSYSLLYNLNYHKHGFLSLPQASFFQNICLIFENLCWTWLLDYVRFERVMITSCKSFSFRNPLLANVEIKVLLQRRCYVVCDFTPEVEGPWPMIYKWCSWSRSWRWSRGDDPSSFYLRPWELVGPKKFEWMKKLYDTSYTHQVDNVSWS